MERNIVDQKPIAPLANVYLQISLSDLCFIQSETKIESHNFVISKFHKRVGVLARTKTTEIKISYYI